MLLLSVLRFETNLTSLCRCMSTFSKFTHRKEQGSFNTGLPLGFQNHTISQDRWIAFNKYNVNTHIINNRRICIKSISNQKEARSSVPESNLEKTSKWLTIPNCLTLFRMAVSPYLGYLVLTEEFSWALGLFILAGFTDALDGWIARNIKGQGSIIGSYIDPFADKVLMSILVLSLTSVNIIPVPLCGMIVLRDILLVTTSSHFHYKSLQPPRTLQKFLDFENSPVKMEPTEISKYNTFLQLGLVTISIAAPIYNLMDHTLLHAYWYLVGTSTVVSGLSYFVKDKAAYRR